MEITLVVAYSRNRVIGREGGLPWRLSADLRRFKQLTLGHHLVIGRRTWDSIGRPLPDRKIVVVSRSLAEAPDGVELISDLEEALELARARGETEVMVGGGAQIYELALPLADRVHATRVEADIPGDTFFPPLAAEEWAEERLGEHPADDRNEYAQTYLLYRRR